MSYADVRISCTMLVQLFIGDINGVVCCVPNRPLGVISGSLSRSCLLSPFLTAMRLNLLWGATKKALPNRLMPCLVPTQKIFIYHIESLDTCIEH